MRNLHKALTIAFLPYIPIALIFSACEFRHVSQPDVDKYYNNFVRKKTVALNSSAALEVAKNALEGMGYEIQSINKEIGIVRSKPRQEVVPNVCDCGTWNLDPVHGTADSTVIINVEAVSAERSTLTIEHECFVIFSGRTRYGVTTHRESYFCASRGVIENEFWSILNRILTSRGVPQ